jgi:hypothetical protein
MTIACMRHAERPLELISYQALCVVHRYLQNAFYRRNAPPAAGVFWIVEACAGVRRPLGSGWIANMRQHERGDAHAGRAATTLGPAACPLGSKDERDPPGSRHGTQRSVGLDQAPRSGDQTGSTRCPTCRATGDPPRRAIR